MPADDEQRRTEFPYMYDARDAAVIAAFLRDYLLYQPLGKECAPSILLWGWSCLCVSVCRYVPPGMTAQSYERVMAGDPPTGPALSTRKVCLILEL